MEYIKDIPNYYYNIATFRFRPYKLTQSIKIIIIQILFRPSPHSQLLQQQDHIIELGIIGN